MTVDIDRRQALEMLGYTARQAAFLALVALHGGYFLRRQYLTYAGTSHGLAAIRFLARCQAREHIRVLPYGRRGHVFHVCAKPLYAAIGQENNRNRRPAEWDAVMRKLMTLDFVIAHPTARFYATETEKVEFLRDRVIQPDIWPCRRYPPRHAGGRPTTRYFVDKMPWYQDEGDARLWIAYVDTERTLQGFQSFLSQYRRVLASLPSGVTYVAPSAWHGVIHKVFTTALRSFDSGVLRRFAEYCHARRALDDASSNTWLTPGQRLKYDEQRAEFLTPAFEALYAKFRQTSSIWSADVDAALVPSCLLRVHALGHRYDPGETPPHIRNPSAR